MTGRCSAISSVHELANLMILCKTSSAPTQAYCKAPVVYMCAHLHTQAHTLCVVTYTLLDSSFSHWEGISSLLFFTYLYIETDDIMYLLL